MSLPPDTHVLAVLVDQHRHPGLVDVCVHQWVGTDCEYHYNCNPTIFLLLLVAFDTYAISIYTRIDAGLNNTEMP